MALLAISVGATPAAAGETWSRCPAATAVSMLRMIAWRHWRQSLQCWVEGVGRERPVKSVVAASKKRMGKGSSSKRQRAWSGSKPLVDLP